MLWKSTKSNYVKMNFIIYFIYIKTTYGWSYNPVCLISECCNDDYVPGSISKLREHLREKVYGQHLVEEVMHAIAAHWDPHNQPSKALALSFHGWPGGGKNYVSNFIAESLYKKGSRSSFVHSFIGRVHFPLKNDVLQYKQDLYQWIKGNISSCPKQLYIFDEVEKIPVGVLNAIQPLIDHRTNVEGYDFRRTIFIFLSNTGSSSINKLYEEYWKNGKTRESLTLHDFEKLIMKGAFNEEGGFHHCDAIKGSLIDHYIPFLPMEEKHVVECIKDKFREYLVLSPKPEHIKEVLDYVEWGPEPSKLFSKTGCKRISSKVALLVSKYYKTSDEKSEL